MNNLLKMFLVLLDNVVIPSNVVILSTAKNLIDPSFRINLGRFFTAFRMTDHNFSGQKV